MVDDLEFYTFSRCLWCLNFFAFSARFRLWWSREAVVTSVVACTREPRTRFRRLLALWVHGNWTSAGKLQHITWESSRGQRLLLLEYGAVWERVALLSFLHVSLALSERIPKSRVMRLLDFWRKPIMQKSFYSFINSSLAWHSTQNVGAEKEFPCAIIFSKWTAERQGELGNLRF